jgi:photosystem II stability/assembly factor-like uncharacterized protein
MTIVRLLRRTAFAAGALVLAQVVAPPSASALAGPRWRLLGPFRAGWATAVAGVPGDPARFYFGAADGGVWRTDDAGRTWEGLFQDQTVASIGALALAPSRPQVMYVGTGQVTSRYDIVSGQGVFRSDDGGATWTARGLAESRHIGDLRVDPRDPDVVLVAALGAIFAPSAERGVFRTQDGGRTWQQVLFHDADTGAVDLASADDAPDVVYAALWQVRHHPWQAYWAPDAGAGSGIWRSSDNGRTWTRLSGGGLPTLPLGRVGLAVGAGSGGRRVYASVIAGEAAGLYRSDDAGATWVRINPDRSLTNNYFSRLTPHPTQGDTLYAMGRSLQRSTDGGATFEIVKGSPGGDDYHAMWIDPLAPERQIVGADQGAVVTLNGGRTWSSWYNQPTGQFYHLGADTRFPYRVYSSQQDSGTVGIASRSDYGQLTFRDWQPVGGDERDFALPDPADPDIVYSSGLGGRLSRYDARTGRVANVTPWPEPTYGRHPLGVRYRYPWITALAISPLAPHAIYQGAQVLFRSTSGGRDWETISPDLTGADPAARDCGGAPPLERASACGFGTIWSIAPSPRERDQVWVGSDNGRIHVTRDGGRLWLDATPRELPDWSKIAALEASPHEAGTAFAAVDRHRLDDFRPYIWITHDFGRTWRLRNQGLPADAHVNVVRQDPLEPRLLFAGTRRGAHVSFDGGENWQALQEGLPTSGVNDLLVRGDDVLAATQGRALWAFDDIAPLRQIARHGAPTGVLHLYAPSRAVRVGGNENRDTPLPREEPTAPNPPAGVALDYHVGPGFTGALTLEIADANGRVLRRFRSDEAPARVPAERYFEQAWLRPAGALATSPGAHRVYWDLRGPRPVAPEYDYAMAAVPGADTPTLPRGALVAPGRYEARLVGGGVTLRQPIEVVADPRVTLPAGAIDAQLALHADVAAKLERATRALEQHEALRRRLQDAARGRAHAAAARLEARLAALEAAQPGERLTTVIGLLSGLAGDLEHADGPPTSPQRAAADEWGRQVDAALLRWQAWQREHAADLKRLETR